MTASEKIARLEALLQAERKLTASLRGQLAAQGVEPVVGPPNWTRGLTGNDVALMMMLLNAHPRVVRFWDLEANLPKRDHVKERTEGVIRTHVHRVRAVLGKSAIERVNGVGYRCSDAFQRQHGGETRRPAVTTAG
jgi:DNA-binding response OmpR family regulator